MKLNHRPIDPEADKDYILERHCRVNYECEAPWKREMTYEQYRGEWFGTQNQEVYINALVESMKDNRTIAEIIEDENGARAAYIWVTFYEDSGFRFADVQDIYVEDEFRRCGIAKLLFGYAEEKARQNGAKVMRSGTGCENVKSIAMHEKQGYYQYRCEFEKLL